MWRQIIADQSTKTQHITGKGIGATEREREESICSNGVVLKIFPTFGSRSTVKDGSVVTAFFLCFCFVCLKAFNRETKTNEAR
jgi:hypothetical protein